MKKTVFIAVALAALLVAGSSFAGSQKSGQMGGSSSQSGQSGQMGGSPGHMGGSGTMMSPEQVRSFCQDLASKQNIEQNRRSSFTSDCQQLHDSRMGGSTGGEMEQSKSGMPSGKKSSDQMGSPGSSGQQNR